MPANRAAVTAALFAGIHLPLAFAGADDATDVITGVGVLLATGIGLRLIIAGLDRWSGGSLLTVGILHGSFNVTPDLIDPAFDWLRYTAAVVLGFVVIGILRNRARHDAGE